MPIAYIAFDFDPYLQLGDRAVRLETLALAGTMFAMLVLAALIAGRTPARQTARATTPPSEPSAHLRRDDLMFVVLGAVAGAIIGGRLGYVLIHLDYYAANLSAIIDPSQGGLELSVALVAGAVAGAYVAQLLEGPVGRWAHIAVVPVFLGLVLGKAAMILGGSGQGTTWNEGLATAFLGPGPWGSIAPATPAYPAQLIEAGLTLLVLLAVAALIRAGRFADRDGRAFVLAVGLWAIARFGVAFTWRDPTVLGPLRADQLVSLAIVAGSGLLFAWATRRAQHGGDVAVAGQDLRSTVEWPDPAERRYL